MVGGEESIKNAVMEAVVASNAFTGLRIALINIFYRYSPRVPSASAWDASSFFVKVET